VPDGTGRIAVLGESARVAPFALAGAIVAPADEPAAVRTAWRALPADVLVVILTPAAAAALDDASLPPRAGVLTVTLP